MVDNYHAFHIPDMGIGHSIDTPIYLDYFEKVIENPTPITDEIKTWWEFKNNLEAGFDLCQEIAQKEPYKGENLDSLYRCVKQQRFRLQLMISRLTN